MTINGIDDLDLYLLAQLDPDLSFSPSALGSGLVVPGVFQSLDLPLKQFCKEAWHVLEPGTELQWSWIHDLFCEYLEATWKGEFKNLLINCPPRHLKSRICSVLFPVWTWTQDPTGQFLCLSYATSLAIDHNSERRLLIQSDWFQELYPLDLQLGKNRLSEFANEHRGFMIARGFDGAVTGVGASSGIIVDDPNNPEKKESPEVRKAHLSKFRSYSSNRKNRPDTPVIVFQQRCSQDDISGYIKDELSHLYEIVIVPQLEQEDKVFVMPRTRETVERKAGVPIDPVRYNLFQVSEDRQIMGEAIWQARHQQKPVPAEGEVIQWQWFRRYSYLTREESRYKLIVQSLDAAATKKATSSHWALITCGVTVDDTLELLHIHRRRYRYPEGKRAVRQQFEEWGADLLLVENKSSGIQLIQELTDLPILSCNPEGDKVMRAELESSAIQAGQVFVPREEFLWLSEFENEIKSFPDGANDQVDALSQLLKWHRENCKRRRVQPVGTVHRG